MFYLNQFSGKTNLFKQNFIAILSVLFIATACSENEKPNNPTGDNNTSDLTASNWQTVIKDVYGFDITAPVGWTFKEGKRQSSAPSYSIQFTTTAEDFDAEYLAFVQYIFDLTASIVPSKGNYDDDGTIEEIPTMMGILMPLWNFDTPKYAIQLDIMESKTTKTAQIYMVALKSL